MDFNSLTAAKGNAGSIQDWVGSSRVDGATVLAEAESYIYRRLRVREMLTSQTGTIAADATALTLPSDFIAPWDFRLTGVHAGEIKLRTPTTVRAHWAYDGADRITGLPTMYYVEGTGAVFDRKTDKAYGYDLLYYGQPEALSGTNTTNFLTSRAPRLLRLICMGIAFDWLENAEEYDRYLMLAEAEVQRLNAEGAEAMYRGLDEGPRVI